MKSRTEFEAEHRRTWEAIPWVVNGSAGEAQLRLVENHALDCEDCRAELARQRELQAAILQVPDTLTDPDLGLQRLWKRIDDAAEESAAAPAARAAPARPAARRGGAGALVYGLTFAVVVEAVGISVLGMGLLSHTGPAPSYRTLSDPAGIDARATIRIVPAPEMSLGELHGLLQSLELQVVAGPNEAGAYALAPLSEQPATDSQIARLRAMSSMRLVEPIRARGAGS